MLSMDKVSSFYVLILCGTFEFCHEVYEHVGRGDKLLTAIEFKLSKRRPFGTCASYRPTKHDVS